MHILRPVVQRSITTRPVLRALLKNKIVKTKKKLKSFHNKLTFYDKFSIYSYKFCLLGSQLTFDTMIFHRIVSL